MIDELLEAYRCGIFPMADPETGSINWYSPDPRAVIPLESFHVPRSLAQRVRSQRFDVHADTCFEKVIRACAAPRQDEPHSWIDDRIIAVYCLLHDRGHAHCIEAWINRPENTPLLVGGLYGVSIGGAFFGESMFSRPDLGGTDASKVCLVRLVEHLKTQGYVLLDTQFSTPHLSRFGCIEMPRTHYQSLLNEAVSLDVDWGEWRKKTRR